MVTQRNINITNVRDVSTHVHYNQTSNSLFHFMEKLEYLLDALTRMALVPRYCWEDIEYLNIKTEKHGDFKKIAVLQKCFCDIPLNKIVRPTNVKKTKTTTNNKSRSLTKLYTHTDIYGKFAIAFTKEWGKQHRIQPVHYIDVSSPFAILFSKTVCEYLQSDFDDETSNVGAMLELQLALAKPHFGIMQRQDKDEHLFTISKNFFDEQEWRYIPDTSESNFESIIANDFYSIKLHSAKSPIDMKNERLTQIENNSLWLQFDYADISHLIVADDDSRKKIINHLLSLQTDEQNQYLLMSKLLTIEQIMGDM